MAATTDRGANRQGRRSFGRRALSVSTFTAFALLPVASRLPEYARLTAALLGDARIPAARKAILAGVVGYALSPVDLIPDRIPVLGAIDDVVVALLGLEFFLAGIPDELLDARLADVGIQRVAFEEDRARIRRTVPRPVRRVIHRLPGVVDTAGRALRDVRRQRPRPGLAQQGGFSRVKVILTSDVPKLGKSGELKDVAEGFARNFLIAQKLAVPASGGAYRAWQHDIASREEKRKREREEAEIAANRISSTTLTMGVKVGEGGKLYGSITAQDIADALGRRGITVDKHKVELAQPLKTLGTYKVAVKVYSGMTPEVTIVVEPKG